MGAVLVGTFRSRPASAFQGDLGLIVTCEKCATSFQLDEARIPATGARVRCSRCKHAFFLGNPSASQSEAAHSIAAEAAKDSMSRVPSPSVDPEEEDWQFSEEVRIEGDEDLDSGDDFGASVDFAAELDANALLDEVSVDRTALSAAPAVAAAIEVEGLDAHGDPSTSLSETSEPARDKSDFGSIDDFSSLMEDDDVEAADLGSSVESEFASPKSVSDRVGVSSSGGLSDDLGDPESWDLVGHGDVAASRAARRSMRLGVTSAGVGASGAFDHASDVYDEDEGAASSLWQATAGIGNGIGWTVTLVMVAAVLFLSLRPEWTRWAEASQTVSIGPLTAETTNTRWLETSRSGFILVVEGQIRNTGSEAFLPGTVQLAILDRQDRRLTEPQIGAGERLPESTLREASPDQLASSVRAAAVRLRGIPLAPGEVRAFEAVAFESDLPDGARRLLLEVGEATRVSPPPLVQVEEEPDPLP